MVKDAYDGNYWQARAEAFERSGGRCQLCGQEDAIEGHHWEAWNYPTGDEVTSDDITALCRTCHQYVTALRKFTRAGGNRFAVLSTFEGALQTVWKDNTESKSVGLAPSSCVMGRPDSTYGVQLTGRSQKSSGQRVLTVQSQRRNDSPNSNASLASGSKEKRLRSPKELLGR